MSGTVTGRWNSTEFNWVALTGWHSYTWRNMSEYESLQHLSVYSCRHKAYEPDFTFLVHRDIMMYFMHQQT